MLALRYPQQTWLEKIPASLKMALLAIATSGIFFIDSTKIMFLLCVAIISFQFLFGWQILKFSLGLLNPLLPFVAIIAFWHLFTGDLTQGLLIILRLLLIVSLANIVTCSTNMGEISAIIEKILSPLRFTKIFIRFTPIVLERHKILHLAYKCRSGKRPSWQIILPLILTVMDDADHVAHSLRSRSNLKV
jgi:biotin transport system permease protein